MFEALGLDGPSRLTDGSAQPTAAGHKIISTSPYERIMHKYRTCGESW